jgi:oligosaccharyltransferase complex subunit alpha (ribophorin I)
MASALLVLVLLIFACGLTNALKNLKIQSRVDLATQNVRSNVHITVSNDGKVAENEYTLILENGAQLAYITAYTNAGIEGNIGLKINGPIVDKNTSYHIYSISFHQPLSPRAQYQFTLQLTFIQVSQPYPGQLSQSDHQSVRYLTNAHFYSPYFTNSVKTSYFLPTSLSAQPPVYTRINPFELLVEEESGKSSLIYGPYNNIPPHSTLPLSIQYIYNKPLLLVRELDRTIEIKSDSIIVKEEYDIVNNAAKLKDDALSRYELREAVSESVCITLLNSLFLICC